MNFLLTSHPRQAGGEVKRARIEPNGRNSARA